MGEIEQHYKRLVIIVTIGVSVGCLASAALGNILGITTYSLAK